MGLQGPRSGAGTWPSIWAGLGRSHQTAGRSAHLGTWGRWKGAASSGEGYLEGKDPPLALFVYHRLSIAPSTPSAMCGSKSKLPIRHGTGYYYVECKVQVQQRSTNGLA